MPKIGYNEKMKILIATHNPAKLAELKRGLSKLEKKGIGLVSLDNLSISAEPHETGETFQENSLLKAQYYANLSKMPTISDDGGLGIDILNGKPGVKSRRWPGYEASDEELIRYTLLHLRGVTRPNRTANLETYITFYDPKTGIVFSENEKVEGCIAEIPSKKRLEGYPFRALFIVKKFNKYYDELTEKEHEEINHRLKALKRLAIKIESYLL